MPVAVTRLPIAPAVAVNVFTPTVLPSAHDALAFPCASVVTVPAATEPPPPVTASVIGWLGIAAFVLDVAWKVSATVEPAMAVISPGVVFSILARTSGGSGPAVSLLLQAASVATNKRAGLLMDIPFCGPVKPR